MRRARVVVKPNLAKAVKAEPKKVVSATDEAASSVGNEAKASTSPQKERAVSPMSKLMLAAPIDRPSSSQEVIPPRPAVLSPRATGNISVEVPTKSIWDDDDEDEGYVQPSPVRRIAHQPRESLLSPRARLSSICERSEDVTQNMRKKFTGEEELDPKTMRMMDMIYWNPKKEKGMKKKEYDEMLPVDTVFPKKEVVNNHRPAGPQVKISADGRLIIDESSLVVSESRNDTIWETVDDDRQTRKVTSLSFRNRMWRKGTVWTEKETDLFYEILRRTGPDFGLMHEFFPSRARNELKSKFNREEKLNWERVKMVMSMPAILDDTLYEKAANMAKEIEDEAIERKNRKKDKRNKMDTDDIIPEDIPWDENTADLVGEAEAIIKEMEKEYRKREKAERDKARAEKRAKKGLGVKRKKLDPPLENTTDEAAAADADQGGKEKADGDESASSSSSDEDSEDDFVPNKRKRPVKKISAQAQRILAACAKKAENAKAAAAAKKAAEAAAAAEASEVPVKKIVVGYNEEDDDEDDDVGPSCSSVQDKNVEKTSVEEVVVVEKPPRGKGAKAAPSVGRGSSTVSPIASGKSTILNRKIKEQLAAFKMETSKTSVSAEPKAGTSQESSDSIDVKKNDDKKKAQVDKVKALKAPITPRPAVRGKARPKVQLDSLPSQMDETTATTSESVEIEKEKTEETDAKRKKDNEVKKTDETVEKTPVSPKVGSSEEKKMEDIVDKNKAEEKNKEEDIVKTAAIIDDLYDSSDDIPTVAVASQAADTVAESEREQEAETCQNKEGADADNEQSGAVSAPVATPIPQQMTETLLRRKRPAVRPQIASGSKKTVRPKLVVPTTSSQVTVVTGDSGKEDNKEDKNHESSSVTEAPQSSQKPVTTVSSTVPVPDSEAVQLREDGGSSGPTSSGEQKEKVNLTRKPRMRAVPKRKS